MYIASKLSVTLCVRSIDMTALRVLQLNMYTLHVQELSIQTARGCQSIFVSLEHSKQKKASRLTLQ